MDNSYLKKNKEYNNLAKPQKNIHINNRKKSII